MGKKEQFKAESDLPGSHKKVKVWPVVYGDPYLSYFIEVDSKLQCALEFELVHTSDMSGNMFHPHQFFSTDTAGIII